MARFLLATPGRGQPSGPHCWHFIFFRYLRSGECAQRHKPNVVATVRLLPLDAEPVEVTERVRVSPVTFERVTVARVVRSGAGRRDDRGGFAGDPGEQALSAFGLDLPPFHAHCRTVTAPA
jgi:hypothetical protein